MFRSRLETVAGSRKPPEAPGSPRNNSTINETELHEVNNGQQGKKNQEG